MSPTLRSRLGLVATVVGLLAALPLVRALRLGAMDHYLATQTYEDIYYVPPARWLPVMSLGYDRALADLLWMRALIYYGDELSHRGDVEHVFDYAEAILRLDPKFKAVYSWAGTVALYRTGEVTDEDMREAVDFLRRGVEQFPDDGELAWDLAATLTYEVAPHLPKNEAKELRREAVEHFVVAARRGAGPPWIALHNFTKLRKLGKLEQAARHLEEMYDMARDPDVKERIRRRLSDVRSQAYAEAFRRAQEQAEKARKEDYPYMPPTLYQLVGPRPIVDEAELYRRRFLPAPDTDMESQAPAGR